MKVVIGIQAVLIVILIGLFVYRDTTLSRRIADLQGSLVKTNEILLGTQTTQEDQLKRELDRIRRGK